jgi:hypothetical protein
MTPAFPRAQCAHTARTDTRSAFRLTQPVLSIPDTSTCMDEAFRVSRPFGRQVEQHTANAVWE